MRRAARFVAIWLVSSALVFLGGYLVLRYLVPTELWVREAIVGFFREQGMEARIGELAYRPPVGVRFEYLSFRPIDGADGGPPFVIERGEIQLRLAALLRSTAQIAFRFDLWDGRIEGLLSTRREDGQPAVRIEAEFAALDLARITTTGPAPPVMTGRLDGRAVVGWTGIDSRQARGTVDLVARGGAVALPVALPDGTRSLPFATVTVPLVLELPLVRVHRAVLDGQAPIVVTGQVIVGEGAPGTILDLRISLPMRLPDGSIDFESAVSFGLKGTAARPQISV